MHHHTVFSVILLSVKIVKYPNSISKNCRGGVAKIYDECSNQAEIFEAALIHASRENKTLLVSYGAEWCIWCHVFEAHINGKKSYFKYTYADPSEPDKMFSAILFEHEKHDAPRSAVLLKSFVCENFVVVHI